MLVKQRSKFDCALACLAMVSGKQYEELFDPEFCARIEQKTTCSGDDLAEAYRRAGFVKDKNMRVIYIGYGASVPVIRQMLWGRRAMIQVPSLNYEGSEHFIYWNGREIFDPSNKQVYRFSQHIFPTYVSIFDEIERKP